MAINIPMPGQPGDALLKGIDTGSSLFARIMQPKLEREKMQQLESHFQQELALRKAAQARAGANADLQRALLQQRLDNANPAKKLQNQMAFLKNLQEMAGGREEATPASQMPSYIPGIGGANKENGNLMSMLLEEKAQGLGALPEENPFVNALAENENEMPLQIPKEENIPALNPNATSEYALNKPKSINGIPLDYLMQALTAKSLGVPLPKQGGKEGVLHGPARDAADLARAKELYGENSETYQNAKALYEANLGSKKDLRDLRARTKAGLRPGEKEFFDKNTGVPLGKEMPLTAKERESEEGNILFNDLYPYVYKGASPLSGQNSIRNFAKAIQNYSTDKTAQKIVDDYLLADKMLGATTVNEASTLKAGRTNRTYAMLKETLDAQDIPNTVKKLFKEYGLPASAQLKASMRYQELLSKARKHARTSTPATQKLYYNPELQAKNENSTLEGNPVALDNKVVVVSPEGKRFRTTKENASHLPEGWRPELQAKNENSILEGGSPAPDNKVIVISPEGKRFRTTKENASHLPEGWRNE